jgi:histidyl-tRNA synthetase
MSQKIQNLTGMNDILPDETVLWQKLETVSRDILSRYGYGEIRTPLLEDTSLFSRGIGTDTQVVQKEMYTFEDRSGDSITLRPEGTASVVRAYVQHALKAQEDICKLYYMGPMFRHERPQKGRLRQFHQIGAEIFGTDSPHADAEIVTITDRIAKGVGLSGYTIDVNSLGTHEERRVYLAKLKAYFVQHQTDLCAECQKRLEANALRILDCKNEACQKLSDHAPKITEHLGEESQKHFAIFQNDLNSSGIEFHVNPRIVRGLDYYERTTFEFISDKLGSQSAFAGGGRYNQLVAELGGDPTSAVGVALGCERLILLMQEALVQNQAPSLSGVYFVSFDEPTQVKARELLQKVRDAGVRAEAAYESKSLKSQMRRANKLGYRYAALLGGDEMARQEVTLKDLSTGEQRTIAFDKIVVNLK